MSIQQTQIWCYLKVANNRQAHFHKYSALIRLTTLPMINLNDIKWKGFDGGYRRPYDASVPLTRLEQATSPEEIDEIERHKNNPPLPKEFEAEYLITT